MGKGIYGQRDSQNQGTNIESSAQTGGTNLGNNVSGTKGQLILDASNELFVCSVAGVAGSATWVRADGETEESVTGFAYDANGNKIFEARYLDTTSGLIDLESLTSPSSISARVDDQVITKYYYDELNRPVGRTIGWELGADDDQDHAIFCDDVDSLNIQPGAADVRNVMTVDPWNSSVVTTFDQLGRKISRSYRISSTLEGTTSWEYDSVGNLIKEDLPVDADIEHKYDAVNRVIEDYQDSELLRTYVYDGNGRLTEQTDYRSSSDSTTTRLEYDDLGRLRKKIEDADGTDSATKDATTEYVYDGFGNVVETYDAEHTSNPAVTYQYDELNRVIKKTNADNTSEEYYHDIYSGGDRFEQTVTKDSSGTIDQKLQRKFDKLDRLVQVEVDHTGDSYLGMPPL